MKYVLIRTDKANDQLSDIIHYIAADSGDANIALAYLDKIETAVMELEDFPYQGVQPRYSILRRQRYRVLIVERHLIFYKVNEAEKTVCVYAVMDGRREYRSLI
jgi:toxin ParE1/3/4